MEALYGHLLLIAYAAAALGTAGHALLHKRDPRSAWAWITACWLFPLGGALLYFWFGINRIERRARRELGAAAQRRLPAEAESMPEIPGVAAVEVCELVRMGRITTGQPLLSGNSIRPLHNAEEAYPDMLAAIANATRSIWLASYIFDAGEAARRFAQALAEAQRRGVQVRVLLDGVGDLAWFKAGSTLLREHGVPVQRFLPLRLLPPMLHINLRNHHKLLVVDGRVAYAGGMNISDVHYLRGLDNDMADLHFRIEGPVVFQLAQVFAENWRFAAGENLPIDTAPIPARGTAFCRAITDGPNDAVDRLQLVLLAAMANAHRRICIMTPYFIPTPELSGVGMK
jgi:cardiolipin synthase